MELLLFTFLIPIIHWKDNPYLGDHFKQLNLAIMFQIVRITKYSLKPFVLSKNITNLPTIVLASTHTYTYFLPD